MELLLIRHGITKGNELRQYIGSTDQPLSKAGRELAALSAQSIPHIDGLWFSPMLRCRQTAEILFPGMAGQTLDGLRECDFGDFEEKTWEELKDLPVYQRWIDGEEGATPPGGESREAFRARAAAAVALAAENALALGLKRAAIVTHGGVIMSAMEEYCLEKREFYEWQPKNCGGFLVEPEDDPLRFRLLEKL